MKWTAYVSIICNLIFSSDTPFYYAYTNNVVTRAEILEAYDAVSACVEPLLVLFWAVNYESRIFSHIAYIGVELWEEEKIWGFLGNRHTYSHKSGLTEQLYTYKDGASYKNFLAVDRAYGWSENTPLDPVIRLLKEEMWRESHPVLTKEEIFIEQFLNPCNEVYGIKSAALMRTDYSNIYFKDGVPCDLAKLTHKELQEFSTHIRLEDQYRFERLECVRSMYNASIPNVKLFYPEPYIASPSYIHEDLGFLHILQYQFWLWFVFVFLICFFFITFLCVVRWCNMRTQPRRETRGVSRSKCGDLITASVPVTWATSIIVTETTDALDYYDGFGTSEIVVGIRAYQWGWEYYYPKNIDLNYNVQPNYSSFIGNSIKYTTCNESTLDVNSAWRFYQNKKTDEVVTPAHLLLLPLDNNKVVNFVNFDNIGASHLKNSHAFKKIRTNSKVYNTNLVYSPLSLNSKYIALNQLHTNDNSFYDTLSYGLKRQHSLTSINATTNTYASFLDKKSMDIFLNSNLNYNSSNVDLKVTDNLTSTYTPKTPKHSTQLILTLLLLSGNLEKPETSNSYFKNITTNPSVWGVVNADSDKKSFNKPIMKFFNDSLMSKVVNGGSASLGDNMFIDSINNDSINYNSSNLYTVWQNTAPNGSVLPAEQSVRQYNKLSAVKGHYNLNPHLNIVLNQFYDSSKNVHSSKVDFFHLLQTNHANSDSLVRLLSNRLFFEAPYAPVKSTNSFTNDLNYDSTSNLSGNFKFNNNNVILCVNQSKGELSSLLKGRREGVLKALNTAYWDMFWSNSHIDLRLKSAILSSLKTDLAYIPLFTNYDDYDFRNAQALELLEDAFWETSYSSYNHYDYINISQNTKKDQTFGSKLLRLEEFFYKLNLTDQGKFKVLYNPVIKDLSSTGLFYTNSLQSDDLVTSSTNLLKKDFTQFVTSLNLSNMDDSYLNSKEFANYLMLNNQTILNIYTGYQFPQSYINVFNTYRADFDDFSTHTDVLKDLDLVNLHNMSSLMGNLFEDDVVNNQQTLRLSNPLVLRSTARNSIVTYNALQKVFRSRFDEGRSLTSLQHFSNISTKQPFMTDSRVPYESLLGKNRESFYTSTFYNSNLLKLVNFTTNPLNTYFFEFPFLSSKDSDVSRHLWFDWYAKWGMYEVQPSSVSKYSTLGVPYSKKHFDFNAEMGDDLVDNETYFTRMSRSRKNYLSSWMYSPYLFLRNSEWNNNSSLSELIQLPDSVNSVEHFLHEMGWYWKSLAFSINTSNIFNGTNSAQNIYSKSTWRPFAGVHSYYYNVNNLIDILSKREYIYRQFFENQFKLTHLPNILTANPKNPLINELKSSFLFVDPITYTSEYSRDLYLHSLTFFKTCLLSEIWLPRVENLISTQPINLSTLNKYLFFYFLDSNLVKNNNDQLLKSQYRPLRKGVNSMLRLQATGAVAMPIEIRIQILASSRDVIHSWAVPSAGIKIDCIPGYTSHRIMIFLVAGIYWGQCMEICGRYHHWMPIIVYFMKRDLFFLWCTHFVFKSGVNDVWDITDRQYTDYIRFASYDKASWLAEVSKRF